MKTISAAAAAFVVLISIAGSSAYAATTATTWYGLNEQEGKCMVMPRGMGPQSMREYVRSIGHIETTKITRNDDGSIFVVVVSDETKGIAAEMFTKAESCEKFLNFLRSNGTMPAQPDELQ